MDESELAKDRELKQNYLKDHVISVGYDGSKFAEFLDSKRPSGTDIDVWTYEELIACVQEFTQGFKDIDEQEFYESEQIDFHNNPTIELDSIDIQKLENLNKKTIIGGNTQTKSKIIKEEKEKTGMFSTKIFYTIQTTPMNFVVKRNFEHFEWLRSKFFATYPGAFVPPIESDSNRAEFLNNFLQSILGFFSPIFLELLVKK